MTTEELIKEAFADVSYPGDEDIAYHMDCLECDEIRAYFRGKSWSELKFPELHAYHESLPLLSPAAYHYFLPGYMLATLADWDQADMIPYGIITIGGYFDDAPGVKEEAKANRRIFTKPQRGAIAAYLVELRKNGPAEWRDDEAIPYAVSQILEATNDDQVA